MKHFAYISLIIWFVTTLPAHAQYEYTLKQCLEEGLLNNYSLRISRNEENKKKRSFKRKMVLDITPNTKFVYSLSKVFYKSFTFFLRNPDSMKSQIRLKYTS